MPLREMDHHDYLHNEQNQSTQRALLEVGEERDAAHHQHHQADTEQNDCRRPCLTDFARVVRTHADEGEAKHQVDAKAYV